MLQKTTSSLIVLMMLCGFSTMLTAQEAPKVIWRSIMITPDKSNLKTLQDNIRSHNIKYHKDIPYKAFVFMITSGPHVGKIIWQMGTFNFTDFDSRPAEGAHNDDWRDNVMPYITDMTHGEYWKTNLKHSLIEKLDTEKVSHPILLIRIMDVNQSKSYLINQYLQMTKTTIAGIEDHSPWGVYNNMFSQGNAGRHLASVRFLKNYGELDITGKFKESFLKVHGENAWQKYLDIFDDAFSNSWHEMRAYNPYMSGQ